MHIVKSLFCVDIRFRKLLLAQKREHFVAMTQPITDDSNSIGNILFLDEKYIEEITAPATIIVCNVILKQKRGHFNSEDKFY